MKLHWQILLALVLAVAVGLVTGPDTRLFGLSLTAAYQFVGSLFMNGLRMLIVPLIMSSIITGVAGLGARGDLGRLGGRTLLYYMTTSLLAILVGLGLVDLFQPGIVGGQPAREALGLAPVPADLVARVQGKGTGDLVAIFLRMVPVNIVSAAAQGQMLGLIFFSLLFGYFMSRIEGEPARTLHAFWEGVFGVMMCMTEWIMRFAPLGVFALVTRVVATTGLGAFRPLLVFFVTVLLALAVHALVVLPALLRLLGRVDPRRHYRAMAPALLTAFSTASSSATLPVTMECVERGAGVSNRVTSFVLPLGATVNMDGTALYECVAALFIAQAYGLHLSFATQFSVVVIALLTSIGVAGIPAASLVAISVILGSIGLPLEAVGLILAVDRVLDMCRTAVNVFSDSCGAVLMARLEGERPLA